MSEELFEILGEPTFQRVTTSYSTAWVSFCGRVRISTTTCNPTHVKNMGIIEEQCQKIFHTWYGREIPYVFFVNFENGKRYRGPFHTYEEAEAVALKIIDELDDCAR